MKLLDMRSMNKFHDAKLQKWATKVSILTFLHHEHSTCYRISSVLSSYVRVMLEGVQMHAVVCHVRIAPLVDFRPFLSSTTKSCAFDNNCWAVMDSE